MASTTQAVWCYFKTYPVTALATEMDGNYDDMMMTVIEEERGY